MDVRLPRSGIHPKTDPHGWNNWDKYKFINEKRLAEHPFVDSSKPHTLQYYDSGSNITVVEGYVFCKQGVVLEVQKRLEKKMVAGRVQVRGLQYRYVAWIPRDSSPRGTPVLRYHNIHVSDEDYHHRVFNPQTGEQLLYEKLERSQFPVMSDILNEIAVILECYPVEHVLCSDSVPDH